MAPKSEAPITFARGVANRMAEAKTPKGFARLAKDVDISNDGSVSRRPGFAQVAALAGAHSLWSDTQLGFALVASGNALRRFDASGTLTSLVTTLTGARVHYSMTPRGAYWSDGQVAGYIDPLGVPHAWGVETPSNVIATATTGALPPGRFAVTATFGRLGEEGGAPKSQYVDLPSGGGISVTVGAAVDTAVDEARVYVSTVNGEELQYAASCTPGGSLVVSATPRGRPLRTQYLTTLPPLRYPALSKGRLFGLVDRFLVWSEPLYYGLYHPAKNFASLPGVGTMLAIADEAGFCAYIGTDKFAYKFVGDTLENATLVRISDVGVVPGSMAWVAPDAVQIDTASTWVPVWIDTNGIPWAGVAGGVKQLHDKFVYPQLGTAAAIFDQRNGNNRYIVSSRGNAPSVLAFKDSFTASVIDAGGGVA